MCECNGKTEIETRLKQGENKNKNKNKASPMCECVSVREGEKTKGKREERGHTCASSTYDEEEVSASMRTVTFSKGMMPHGDVSSCVLK